MPYKSEAQRRKLKSLMEAGKISPEHIAELDKETEGLKLPERVQPVAVIIKGSPKKRLLLPGRHPVQEDFYKALGRFVKSRGYNVKYDEGLPYTTPRKAEVWIGHSRGVDRLRFAPRGTAKIRVGSLDRGSVVHPVDKVREMHTRKLLEERYPGVPYAKLTMKARRKAEKESAKLHPFEGDPHHTLTKEMKAKLDRLLQKPKARHQKRLEEFKGASVITSILKKKNNAL